jgi:hypothetical protein
MITITNRALGIDTPKSVRVPDRCHRIPPKANTATTEFTAPNTNVLVE